MVSGTICLPPVSKILQLHRVSRCRKGQMQALCEEEKRLCATTSANCRRCEVFGKRHLKTEPNQPTVVKWDIAWTCFKTSLHLEWHKSMVGIWQLLSCMSSVSPKRSLCLSPLCGSCVTRCFRKCPKVRNTLFPPMSTAAWILNDAPSFWSPVQIEPFHCHHVWRF